MGGNAWVTLATNDSYSLGAMVLAYSLRKLQTEHSLAILITSGVSSAMKEKLSTVFDVIKEVNLLDSKDETNLLLLKRPELGITFTKLHCWQLTQFEKCVFLDADTLVLQNCDELFERDEFSAAPDVGWPDCFNSGVFVYRPSIETFNNLVKFAGEKGSFDGGDQGLLNLYFSGWAHTDISKHLPFIYNMCSTACYSYLPAFKQFGEGVKIVHFIGTAKPWLQQFDTETRTVIPSPGCDHLRGILQTWWNIFCSNIYPQLTPAMNSECTTTNTKFEPVTSSYAYPSQEIRNIPANYEPERIPEPVEEPAPLNFFDPWEHYNPNPIHYPDVSYPETHHQESYHCHVELFTSHESQPFKTHDEIQHHQDQYNRNNSDQHSHNPNTFSEPQNPNTFSGPQNPNTFSEPQKPNTFSGPQSPNTFSGQRSPNTFSESNNHVAFTEPYCPNTYSESHNSNHHSESHNSNHHSESHNSNHHSETNNLNAYSEPDRSNELSKSSYHEVPSTHESSSYHEPFHQPESQKNEPNQTLIPDNLHRDSDRLPVNSSSSLETSFETKDNSLENAGLAGAFAQMTLGAPRSSAQTALEDHFRRQSWEVGNIDYRGRDSFANIWKKISETLSEPLAAASEEASAEPSKDGMIAD